MQDTRDKNKYFDRSSLDNYFNEYQRALCVALKQISTSELSRAHTELSLGRHALAKVFVGGNGGSAAISEHLNCDFTKGCAPGALNVISLNASHSLHTAIANDMGYDKTLSYQMQLRGFGSTSTLILISSSGNSPNIIEAAKYARGAGGFIIALTGFDGGELKKIADINLHVPVQNYGLVEDCHQILMHVLAQYMYLKNE